MIPNNLTPNIISMANTSAFNELKQGGWSRVRYILNTNTMPHATIHVSSTPSSGGYMIPMHPKFWYNSDASIACAMFEYFEMRDLTVNIVPVCGTTCTGSLAFKFTKPDENVMSAQSFEQSNNQFAQVFARLINSSACEILSTWTPYAIAVPTSYYNQGKTHTNLGDWKEFPSLFTMVYSDAVTTDIGSVAWVVIDAELRFSDLNLAESDLSMSSSLGWDLVSTTTSGWRDVPQGSGTDCSGYQRIGYVTSVLGTTRDQTPLDPGNWVKLSSIQMDTDATAVLTVYPDTPVVYTTTLISTSNSTMICSYPLI